MDFINQNIMLITLVVVSGASLLWQFTAGGGKGQVSPAEATRLINQENAVVLDVRESDEFAAGHLPDAIHLPLGALGERIGELEKFRDRAIVVCCATGMRSGKACGVLAKQGFAKAHGLAGGVDAWLAAGYPLRKGGRGK